MQDLSEYECGPSWSWPEPYIACGLVYYRKTKGIEYSKHEAKVGPALLQWAIASMGPPASNLAESPIFFRHEDLKGPEERSLDLVAPPGTPDIELLHAPVNYLNHALDKLPQKDAKSLGIIHTQPTSRGTLTPKGVHIDSPLIDPGYISTMIAERCYSGLKQHSSSPR